MNVLTHACDSFPPELWLAAVFLFRNVLHPAILAVIPDFQRHLRELVQIQEEIYHRNRQMQDKGGDASHGHDDSPHIDRIADQSEPGIAAGAEYTADDGGTERFADQIVGADKQHEPQVSCACGLSVPANPWMTGMQVNRITQEAAPVMREIMHSLFPVFFACARLPCPSSLPMMMPAPVPIPRHRQAARFFAICAMELAATASVPRCPMITDVMVNPQPQMT